MSPKYLLSGILLFVFCTLFAQKPNQPMFNYSQSWKEVEAFEGKNLPTSAMAEVDKIYAAAKAESNASQLVKAIIYQLKYTEYKEEESFKKNVDKINAELKTAVFPVKPLLHSMLAEIYWNFYQQNRYRFNQRTETVEFKNDDVTTWSLEKIVEEIISNYQLSLQDADKLKSTSIDIYNDVIDKGNDLGLAYRPTLFDFLGHRAVDFFSNNEPDLITKPAYAFTINSADYLTDAESFTSLNITTRDTFAYKYYALKILQELIKLHLNDKEPGALVDVDLKRLRFVYQYLTMPDKQDIYIKSLQKLESKIASHSASVLVSLEIATVLDQQANEYKPLQSDDHKWDRKKAYEICTNAIKRFPNSNEAKQAYNFQRQLENRDISAIVEKVNIPNLPFKAMVTYRNVANLYWRIIPVTREEVTNVRFKYIKDYNVDREQKFIEYFAAKKPQASGKVVLPNDGDYQNHSVEIKLDQLSPNNYIILFSGNENFDFPNNGLAYAFTTISNIAYMHRNRDDGTTDFYTIDRTTGEPVPNVSAQILFRVYNDKAGRYELSNGPVLKSNAEGYIQVPYQNKKVGNSYYNSFIIDFSLLNDKLSTGEIDFYNNYNYSGDLYQNVREEYSSEHTYFFLDRAIYRPGQTLYYKGLYTKTNGKTSEILKNRHLTVTFYDVNWQVVAQKDVTTNDFGSFSGTFTTPSGGLLGQMTLQASDNNGSQVSFSVEEYKRPKFEVKFDPIKGTFKLNQDILVKGKALAYSGANIDGAAVKYRVIRKAIFPWWWWCWYGYYPSSPEMEIVNGTAVTDTNGSFDINFKAIPDESISKTSSPTFIYQVNADVTDINGETHSSSTSVRVGYKALSLEVNIADVDKSNEQDIEKSYTISTTNLAGNFEPASGEIKIWKLKSPGKAFRERLWERPDKQLYTKDEYYRMFPNDAYEEENNFYKWEKDNEVTNFRFDTSKDSLFKLKDIKSWDLGKYMLQITSIDKFGEEVKEVAYFEVSDYKSKTPAVPVIFQALDIKTTGEPGEKASILTGSSEKVKYLYELEQDGKILEKNFQTLKNQQNIIEIPIKEEYRGNVAVHMIAIKDNRFYSLSKIIVVPYTNKQLDIKFETFRDKLLPGQEEQWKIKISSKTADKAMAEMVATLYDASLDAFRMHGWYANFFNSMYSCLQWSSVNDFEQENFRKYLQHWNEFDYQYANTPSYSSLNWFGYYFNYYPVFANEMVMDEVMVAGYGTQKKDGSLRMAKSMAPMMKKGEVAAASVEKEEVAAEKPAPAPPAPGSGSQDKAPQDFGDVKVRKNFNETAFFYPQLTTNEQGEIVINFTIPEALTRWKMLGFAHTADLKSGMIQKELVTQKDLMIVPNQPRFFRENDKMVFQAKLTGMTDNALDGQARLEFFDALTMKPVDDLLKNTSNIKDFSLKAHQSTNLEWNIEIPEGLQAITYRIVAKSGNFSDGEEMILPVVTNRTLVTETLPLPIRGNQTKNYKFEKLLNNTSSTLKNHRYTLEFTSNPAWYAVQALPYLIEYPHECIEQLFSRFYANSIASHIANSNPRIKQVFDTWANIQPDALLSNLEKNQELKSAMLQETPWILNAKSESQRKRNVALLFDLNRMANEQERALKKIMDAQLGNGGFPWFPGLPEDRYITQYIVTGIGHLDVMGVNKLPNKDRINNMVSKAIAYMDYKMTDTYDFIKAEAKKGRTKLEDNHLGYYEIQYLYARSYFKNIPVGNNQMEAYKYWISQAKKYWTKQNIYTQGMLALALKRYGDTVIPADIVKSLKERSLNNEEMGMYWKQEYGYFWYQAPIETQALMIEVFDEVANDTKAVEDLKVWLLKQKQTQDWRTTKATSEACYALLRRGTDVLASTKLAEITIGGKTIDPTKLEDAKIEAGTGYFKTAWTASEITPEMGNIQVKKSDEGVAWGAVYWQYFEQLDKITSAETPLKLSKKLFKQQNTDRGPVITPITDTTKLQPGDLVKVRIELRADRTMEYIHLKDMRAAAFEPVETLSTYKYQDGLWYYQSPGDLATNFFIGYLPKGTYVFEYPLRVSQIGDFSNGITTIQCMYAPEFSSHSEGVRVKVVK
jgi:uncharacterized protein YfaS (alpha-2-macroglobulin family)